MTQSHERRLAQTFAKRGMHMDRRCDVLKASAHLQS